MQRQPHLLGRRPKVTLEPPNHRLRHATGATNRCRERAGNRRRLATLLLARRARTNIPAMNRPPKAPEALQVKRALTSEALAKEVVKRLRLPKEDRNNFNAAKLAAILIAGMLASVPAIFLVTTEPSLIAPAPYLRPGTSLQRSRQGPRPKSSRIQTGRRPGYSSDRRCSREARKPAHHPARG